MNTDQIIQGLIKRDRTSQEWIVRAYGPKLLAVCQRYCRDTQLAEDALQETFINVFKYIDSFSGKGSFDGWIRKVAVSCCFAINKKFKKMKWETNETLVENIPIDIPDVFSELHVDYILEKMKLLPLSQYVVFNMFVIEGFRHGEIAALTGIKESTSRVLLTRARVNLIQLLDKETGHQLKKNNSIKYL